MKQTSSNDVNANAKVNVESDKIKSEEPKEQKFEDEKLEDLVEDSVEDDQKVEIVYEFRNKSLWIEHFEKHGGEFPYNTKEEYLEGANKMLANPNKLHKNEKEDGDDVYYLEETNEFIIVSLDGYIRTYFKPSRGKAYFDKQ